MLLNSNCVSPQNKNATEHFKLKMAPLRHTTMTNRGRWPLYAVTEMPVGVFYHNAIGCSVRYWGGAFLSNLKFLFLQLSIWIMPVTVFGYSDTHTHTHGNCSLLLHHTEKWWHLVSTSQLWPQSINLITKYPSVPFFLECTYPSLTKEDKTKPCPFFPVQISVIKLRKVYLGDNVKKML